MPEDGKYYPKTLEEATDIIEDLEHQIRLLEDTLKEARSERDSAEEWLFRAENRIEDLEAELAELKRG